jgi:cytochrome o ubiquinol oxidase operon protein cyoD
MKTNNNYLEEIGVWPRKGNIARTYVVGFIFSIIITLAAYLLAIHQLFSFRTAAIVILVLACLQFFVQITCFLHLGREAGSRDRLALLACAIVIVFILVSGSLWIMFNLNGRMMPSTEQMEQYMNDQTGI